MRKAIMVFGALLCAAIPAAIPAAAQDFSRAEFFAGYNYVRSYNQDGSTANSNGGIADVAFFPTKWLGVVADFGGSTNGGFTTSGGTYVNAPSTSYHYLFGPRVRYGTGAISPFGQVLIGGVSRSLLTSGESVLANAQNNFAIAVGGGVDIKVAHHFSVRAVQLSYVYTPYTLFGGASNNQNGLSIAAGIVIH